MECHATFSVATFEVKVTAKESDRQFRVFGIAEALATKRGIIENQHELDCCTKSLVCCL